MQILNEKLMKEELFKMTVSELARFPRIQKSYENKLKSASLKEDESVHVRKINGILLDEEQRTTKLFQCHQK